MSITRLPDSQTMHLQQQALERVKAMQLEARQHIMPFENSTPITTTPPHQQSATEKNSPLNQGNKKGPISGLANNLFGFLGNNNSGESVGLLGEKLHGTIKSVSQPVTQILDSFGLDGESLIILMVMWAIFNQHKENKTLLLALGYILI